eukprot:jgi/Psemu1/43619/gm1.43619_g
MEGPSSEDLRRPLLLPPTNGSGGNYSGRRPSNDEEALILEEWNASVSEFVAHDGGDENSNCYCPSIDEAPEEDEDEEAAAAEEEEEESDNDGNGRTDRETAHDGDNRPNSDSGWRGSLFVSVSVSFRAVGRCLSRILRSNLLPDCEPTLGSYSVPISGRTSGSNSSSSSNSSNSSNSSSHEEHNESEHENENEIDGATATRVQQKPRKLVDGPGVVKFVKLAFLTFLSIVLVRFVVVREFPDHDRYLRIRQIFLYEGDAILRDLVVFFVVGRMHGDGHEQEQEQKRSGIDTLEWFLAALAANVYFECQGFVPWMQHSVTLYEMHCVWPWQLWLFAVAVAGMSVGVALAHVAVAHQRGVGWIRLGEWLACLVVFVAPVATSPYFHFHHWFAGWLLGMHANWHDKWWSRATMAYCWGMYVNGIAVYGRDPLLTCDYARFLLEDQNCPLFRTETPEGSSSSSSSSSNSSSKSFLSFLAAEVFAWSGFGNNNNNNYYYNYNDGGFQPSDWRNCSSSGYHP